MKLSEHKVYVDAWRHEAVMLFDEDTSHYAEMLVEAHDVMAQLEAENERLMGVLIEHAEYNNWNNPINWCADAIEELDDETN